MISVIIPNFNGLKILQSCFPTNYKILKQANIKDIIVIDDASNDESVKYLQDNFPDITIIENIKNLGFSKTCNKAAAQAKNEILFFLNNDMTIQNFDLKEIQNRFTQKDLFSLTPAIYRKKDQEQSTQNESITTGYFQGGWFSSENIGLRDPHFSPHDGMPILWGCGGASFFCADKFRKLNGFDEIFTPFYVEDLDLGYRAWKQNWKCLYSDKIQVKHMHQATIGTHFSKDRIDQIHLRNKYLFIWKNIHSGAYRLSHFTTLFIKLLTFQINDTRAIIKAMLKLPELINSRKNLLPQIQSDQEILKMFKPYNDIFFE
jgi:GT2 family glycosyltransferase